MPRKSTTRTNDPRQKKLTGMFPKSPAPLTSNQERQDDTTTAAKSLLAGKNKHCLPTLEEISSLPVDYETFRKHTNIYDCAVMILKAQKPDEHHQKYLTEGMTTKCMRRAHLDFYMRPFKRKILYLSELKLNEDCPPEVRAKIFEIPERYKKFEKYSNYLKEIKRTEAEEENAKNLKVVEEPRVPLPFEYVVADEEDQDLINPQPSTSSARCNVSTTSQSPLKPLTDTTSEATSNWKYPVTHEFFKKYTHYKKAVDMILENCAKRRQCRVQDLNYNAEKREQIFRLYFHDFYYSPSVREVIPLSLKRCPKYVKRKIFEIPTITVEDCDDIATDDTELCPNDLSWSQRSTTSKRSSIDSADYAEQQPKRKKTLEPIAIEPAKVTLATGKKYLNYLKEIKIREAEEENAKNLKVAEELPPAPPPVNDVNEYVVVDYEYAEDLLNPQPSTSVANKRDCDVIATDDTEFCPNDLSRSQRSTTGKRSLFNSTNYEEQQPKPKKTVKPNAVEPAKVTLATGKENQVSKDSNREISVTILPSTSKYKYPVTQQYFKTFTYYNEVVDTILEVFAISNNASVRDMQLDAAMRENVFRNYYHAFYYKPSTRKMYPVRIKPCPSSVKTKIFEIPTTTVEDCHDIATDDTELCPNDLFRSQRSTTSKRSAVYEEQQSKRKKTLEPIAMEPAKVILATGKKNHNIKCFSPTSEDIACLPIDYETFRKHTNIYDCAVMILKSQKKYLTEGMTTKCMRRAHLDFYMRPFKRKILYLSELKLNEDCPPEVRAKIFEIPERYKKFEKYSNYLKEIKRTEAEEENAKNLKVAEELPRAPPRVIGINEYLKELKRREAEEENAKNLKMAEELTRAPPPVNDVIEYVAADEYAEDLLNPQPSTRNESEHFLVDLEYTEMENASEVEHTIPEKSNDSFQPTPMVVAAVETVETNAESSESSIEKEVVESGDNSSSFATESIPNQSKTVSVVIQGKSGTVVSIPHNTLSKKPDRRELQHNKSIFLQRYMKNIVTNPSKHVELYQRIHAKLSMLVTSPATTTPNQTIPETHISTYDNAEVIEPPPPTPSKRTPVHIQTVQILPRINIVEKPASPNTELLPMPEHLQPQSLRKHYDKHLTLPYVLRNCAPYAPKQLIICALLQMSFDEFRQYVRIYNDATLQIDDENQNLATLKCYYHFAIVEPQVWPIELYIGLGELQEYLRAKKVPLRRLELGFITPKVLHWSELSTLTNFDEIVRLDYYRSTGENIACQELLQKSREWYYNRCWTHDQWIWQVPAVTDADLNNELAVLTDNTLEETLAKSSASLPTPLGDDEDTMPFVPQTPNEENESYDDGPSEDDEIPASNLLGSRYEAMDSTQQITKECEQDTQPLAAAQKNSPGNQTTTGDDFNPDDFDNAAPVNFENILPNETQQTEVSSSSQTLLETEIYDQLEQTLSKITSTQQNRDQKSQNSNEAEAAAAAAACEDTVLSVNKSPIQPVKTYTTRRQTVGIQASPNLFTSESGSSNPPTLSASLPTPPATVDDALPLSDNSFVLLPNTQKQIDALPDEELCGLSDPLTPDLAAICGNTSPPTTAAERPRPSSGGCITTLDLIEVLSSGHKSSVLDKQTLPEVNQNFQELENLQLNLFGEETRSQTIDSMVSAGNKTQNSPLSFANITQLSMNDFGVSCEAQRLPSTMAAMQPSQVTDEATINQAPQTWPASTFPVNLFKSPTKLPKPKKPSEQSVENSETNSAGLVTNALTTPSSYININSAYSGYRARKTFTASQALTMNSTILNSTHLQCAVNNQQQQQSPRTRLKDGGGPSTSAAAVVIASSTPTFITNRSTVSAEPPALPHQQVVEESSLSTAAVVVASSPASFITNRLNVSVEPPALPHQEVVEESSLPAANVDKKSAVVAPIANPSPNSRVWESTSTYIRIQSQDVSSTVVLMPIQPIKEEFTMLRDLQFHLDDETDEMHCELLPRKPIVIDDDVEKNLSFELMASIDSDSQHSLTAPLSLSAIANFTQSSIAGGIISEAQRLPSTMEVVERPEVSIEIVVSQSPPPPLRLPAKTATQATIPKRSAIPKRTVGGIVPQRLHEFRALPLVTTSSKAAAAAPPDPINSSESSDGGLSLSGGSVAKGFSISQALSTDCSLFNSTELHRAVDQQLQQQMPKDIDSGPLTSASGTVASATSLNQSPVNFPRPVREVVLYRGLLQFRYFNKLSEEHIQRYALPVIGQDKPYMEALIRCGLHGQKTTVYGDVWNVLLPHCSQALMLDLQHVLKDLTEFHYSAALAWTARSQWTVVTADDLRARVLYWFLRSAPVFGYCRMYYNSELRDQGFTERISPQANETLRRKPHRPLVDAIKPDILARMAHLKHNL